MNTIELTFPQVDAERVGDPAYQRELGEQFTAARTKAFAAKAAVEDPNSTELARALTQFELLKLFMAGTDEDMRQTLIEAGQGELERAMVELQGYVERLSSDMRTAAQMVRDAQEGTNNMIQVTGAPMASQPASAKVEETSWAANHNA